MTEIYPDSPELAAYIKGGKESVNAWLARYTLLLISYDVKRVEISYAGSGDSGQIDSIMFFGELLGEEGVASTDSYPYCGDGRRRRMISGPLGSLTAQFEQFLYNLLDRRGWEVNNEGSQGTIIWDLEADSFDHHHETNVTSVEVNEFEDIEDIRNALDPDAPRY